MEAPFVYGKLAVDENFTNRDKELKKLRGNFMSGTNMVLLSPRRWGKSSLVKKAADEISYKEKNIRFVFIDMFSIRTEEGFYKALLERTLQAVSGKLDDVIANIKTFMKQLIPTISFSPDSQQSFSLSLNWAELKKQPDEVLNLAEAIAKSKGYRIIICIDEFQNTGIFKDSVAFQKKIRAHWQTHQHVTYCLYGSKKHMLVAFFSSPSMPFYKFGDLIFLEKIQSQHWEPFIVERFKTTGKSILSEQALKIAGLMENHPYYVQQLSQQVWLRTKKKVKDPDIVVAYDSLIGQMSLLFQNLAETFRTTQINFLRAVVDGVKQFSAKETIDRYQLGTSANVIRLKQSLINKEIIDLGIDGIHFQDPLFSAWFKMQYLH